MRRSAVFVSSAGQREANSPTPPPFPGLALHRPLQNNAAKEKQAGGGAGGGFPQLRSLFTLMSDVLGDPRRRQQLGPVLDQLGEFAREVCYMFSRWCFSTATIYQRPSLK